MRTKSSTFVLVFLGLLMAMPGFNIGKVHASSPYAITTTSVQSNQNSESAVAVDPTNSSIMVVNTPDSVWRQPYSANAGYTWQYPQQLGKNWPTYIGGSDPYLAVGPTGIFYATTYVEGLAAGGNNPLLVLYMISSSNHGVTWDWDPNFYASDNSTVGVTTWTFLNGTSTQGCITPAFTAAGDYEKLAVDNGASSPFKGFIYVFGDFGVMLNGSCDILNGFVRSRDGGNTWDLHVITDPTFSAGEVEKLSITPNGEIYFIRPTYHNGSNNYLLFEKSTDGGNTWSYNFISAQNLFLYTTLAASTGKLYATYFTCVTICNSTQIGEETVDLISSTNDGNTWSSPTVISDSNALPLWTVDLYENCRIPNPLFDCYPEHKPPTIMVTSIGVAVAWTDWRNSVNNTFADVYAYIPSLSAANIRLTSHTASICIFQEKVCTWNGQDFIDSTSSSQGLYFAYGWDIDGDKVVDAVATRITTLSVSVSPLSITHTYVKGGTTSQTQNFNVTLQSTGISGTVTLTVTPFYPSRRNGPNVTFRSTGTNTDTVIVSPGQNSVDLMTEVDCVRTPHSTFTFTVTAVTGPIQSSGTFQVTISGYSQGAC